MTASAEARLTGRAAKVLGATSTLGVGAVLTVVGGIASATSPGPWLFTGGRLIAGFAGGLLAVFGISAAVRHLSAGRGLLLPVPFVMLAQLVIFRSVPPRAPTATARPSWLTLLVPLGVAGFLVADFGPARWCSLVVACIGFRSLMPAGTLSARRGPPAALLALTLFGLGYFGASELLTLLFSDVYQSSLAIAGVVLGFLCRLGRGGCRRRTMGRRRRADQQQHR